MKKFTLFLVAIFAMVNVANAQRAWAYDLELTPLVDSYKFAFKAVTAGDATLVFYKEGEEAGTLNLGPVPAGAYTVTKTSEELLSAIGKAGDFTWGVKMSAGAIAEMKELTKDSETDFHFWMPTGVAVDNNPESPYFGQFYIASPRSGKMSEGGGNGIQHNAGVYVFDQTLKLLNETKQQGYLPSNVKSYVSGNNYMELHRIAVNPITHNVAFTHQSTSVAAAVWEMNPDNMKATATNLIDGTAITKSNSLCFDENGVLYVVNSTDKKVYTVKDGVVKTFGTSEEFGQERNAIATDGRGGVWVAQYRGQNITEDNTARLMHFDAEGTLDYKVDKDTPHDFTGTAQRGAVAYNTKEDVLAFGANRYGNLYKVTYNAETGVPSLESIGKTPSIAANIDGLAFDYAGDLYVTTASIERLFKYAIPTTNNTCTVPAKKSQVIILVSATPEYNVTINVVGEGTVTGANTGTYFEGTKLSLTATPAEHYEFTGWTGDVTSNENSLTINVDGNKTITANFAKKQYTLTVQANDPTKGSVALDPAGSTYEYETEVTLTATANDSYEFVNWSNGSKENPLTISMEEDTELTANFRAILPSSITLNAHPTKDYSTSIVGTMKRAIQNGENTIVLTHEDNSTPHIYNIAHATKEVTEISQVGVQAAADGFLSISDIALTEDGKLVACNYVHCTFTPSNTSYFYIWDDIAGNPRVWFTSQKSGNYNDAYMGYTMALKGTSQNAEVTISAFNKSNSNTRYSHLYVVDGTYTDASYKYSRDNAALHPTTLGKNTYELNASPLAAGKWIVDGEKASPIEFVEKNAVAIDTYTALNTNVLGKKYNGASYLFHNDHHLMIAPYATDDKLAGVKVLGVTDGFGSPVQVETNTALVNAIDATTAAATAYVDGDGDLTIYLIADGKVYTFSEKVYTAQTFTVTATAGEGGSVEGGGTYEEGDTATLTATANEHYDFVNWTGDVTSTENPLMITVDSALTVTANFQEHAKHTITAYAADNTMGYVTGGGTYYIGETVTLKAVANSTYCFVNWSDGVTDAIRTFTATADVTLTANFAKATPRAWAYDLKMVEDEDNYKFSFTATTAANATLLFLDKEGNELYDAHNMDAVAAGANTVSIEKAYFTQVKDVYWSVKMDGEAITAVAEITDQSRGIYDFYSALGVTVDNNPNSEYFGKVYVQATLNGGADGATTRADEQMAGLFIYNQWLDELNPTSNVGIQPSLPAGYGIGGTNQFNRLAIDPITNNITYCYAISGQPAVFSMDRADLTGTPANLLAGQSGITHSVAHCFDTDGALYVMDLPGSGTIYKIKDGVKTQLTETTNKFVNPNITMTSDGRGGLWVSQNRGQMDGSPYYYQLAHVTSAGAIDWAVNQQTPHGFEGGSNRGALAYDVERQILAQGRNGKVELYTVAYDATTGVPTLTPLHTVASDYLGNNIDGLAFDFAGDLYVVNSSKEKFQKFTLPTADNICTVSAPESQAIIKEVRYTVTVNTVGNGTAIGAGEYVAGETATLEATPAAHHKFVNWTYGSETSTNNPLELVVNSEITVTANFAPVQYTLIAPTNDEDKGTVTGAGTYNYGTEVTLTANPAEGYKLLYWSDRSTENPRTITMTKNEAISAYFVKEYAEEPTFKIEKVWENTNVPASTNNGYQAVGWDGKIYMQNKAAGKIITYSSAEDTGTDYATSGSGQQIAVDEAGNLIVFNATFSTANPNAILIYQKGTTEGKAVSFTLKDPAACHFFSASGNIYSAEGGYVYFYCAGKTVINRLKITNGAETTFDVTTDVVGESVYSSPQNTNYVMVDIFGNLVAHARSNKVNVINVHTNESKAFTLPNIKMGTLGGCSFELGGKELWAYHAGANNYSSEWNIYNMTDSKFLSDDDFYAVDKSATTNYACNWLNVQVVDENTAYIYQFCPLKAMAIWKVTLERDDLQEFTVTASANDPAMGTVTGEGTYYKDASATLTATPQASYRFVNWTKAGVEVSTNSTYTFTVTEDVELVANFEALPEITYELNGGVWNKYGWTSKKDMYDAFIADWKAYSGSTRATKTYEEQYGIGKSNGGIPTTIQGTEDVLGFMSQEKWAWLGQFLDAIATAQGTKLPSEATVHMRFALGNFFGEDKNKVGDAYVDAIDCSAGQADLQAFAPYWGQTFPMPTQPTEEVVLNDPYKESYLFDGWYATSDFSGAEVTTVDENTEGTLYAKWVEHFYTHTPNNKYGTICLPYASASTTGAYFYEVAGKEEGKVYLASVDALEAGVPYIFEKTASTITVFYTGEAVSAPQNDDANGLVGTFEEIEVPDGDYILYNDAFRTNEPEGTLNRIRANRAYLNMDGVTGSKPTPMPGRRYIGMDVEGENEATGFENIQLPNANSQKLIINGQLIIIRDGEMYNAQGVRL